jgi:hypothetical protein
LIDIRGKVCCRCDIFHIIIVAFFFGFVHRIGFVIKALGIGNVDFGGRCGRWQRSRKLGLGGSCHRRSRGSRCHVFFFHNLVITHDPDLVCFGFCVHLLVGVATSRSALGYHRSGALLWLWLWLQWWL